MLNTLQYDMQFLSDVNGCYSQPCQNQGQCMNGDRGYTCECQEGWAGVNCEISK